MEVKCQELPTSTTETDNGSEPPNYINFEYYVKVPPEDYFAENLRQEMAVMQRKIANKPSLLYRLPEKAANKLWGRSRLPPLERKVIMMPVDTIVDQLTSENHLSITGDLIDFPDQRAYWRESGSRIWARLAFRDLNPFFEPPGPQPGNIQPDNYIALSYSWGMEKPTEPITINGQQLEVRKNIAMALKRFRTMEYFVSGGKIGIDALCIDQDDEEEKQNQIAILAMIYSLAGNIIVCVSEEEDKRNTISDYLHQLSEFHRTEFIEA